MTPSQPTESKLKERAIRRDKTIKSIKKRSTPVELWSKMGPVAEIWKERAKAAAQFIPPNSRVADIGCANMSLEPLLPPGCTYIPLDVARRDERTIVVDLNRERLPELQVDFIVGLGVLEYLHDIPKFLRQTARMAPNALFSYHPLEKSPARDRLALFWVNALNSSELLVLMRASGYRDVVVEVYKPTLHFYRVSRTRSPEPAAPAPDSTKNI